MKIKENFVLRKISDEYYVIPRGPEADRLESIIKLSTTGGFMWSQLIEEKSFEELIDAILNTYDIDEKTARNAVMRFIDTINKLGCLEND